MIKRTHSPQNRSQKSHSQTKPYHSEDSLSRSSLISSQSPTPTEVDLSGYQITVSVDFSKQDLTRFLTALVSAKNEIIARSKARLDGGDITVDHKEMSDQVDMAIMNVEQNVIFKLLDRDRVLLGQINRAIQKIAMGDYGYCEGSGDVIPHKRLEITPWTRYSVKYQEQLEGSSG